MATITISFDTESEKDAALRQSLLLVLLGSDAAPQQPAAPAQANAAEPPPIEVPVPPEPEVAPVVEKTVTPPVVMAAPTLIPEAPRTRKARGRRASAPEALSTEVLNDELPAELAPEAPEPAPVVEPPAPAKTAPENPLTPTPEVIDKASFKTACESIYQTEGAVGFRNYLLSTFGVARYVDVPEDRRREVMVRAGALD